MKITKKELHNIILEEMQKVMESQPGTGGYRGYDGSEYRTPEEEEREREARLSNQASLDRQSKEQDDRDRASAAQGDTQYVMSKNREKMEKLRQAAANDRRLQVLLDNLSELESGDGSSHAFQQWLEKGKLKGLRSREWLQVARELKPMAQIVADFDAGKIPAQKRATIENEAKKLIQKEAGSSGFLDIFGIEIKNKQLDIPNVRETARAMRNMKYNAVKQAYLNSRSTLQKIGSLFTGGGYKE